MGAKSEALQCTAHKHRLDDGVERRVSNEFKAVYLRIAGAGIVPAGLEEFRDRQDGQISSS